MNSNKEEDKNIKKEAKVDTKVEIKEEVKELTKSKSIDELKEIVKEVINENENQVIKKVEEELKVETSVLSNLSEIQLSVESIDTSNSDIYKLVGELILDNSKIESLIKKSTIIIKPTELDKIMEVIKYLNTETVNSQSQLKDIILGISKAFSDGKLEPHEIPELVGLVYANIQNINIKLTSVEISIMLKIIIYILIESNIIKINQGEFELVTKLLDSSLRLLELNIKIPTNKLCSCFV